MKIVLQGIAKRKLYFSKQCQIGKLFSIIRSASDVSLPNGCRGTAKEAVADPRGDGVTFQQDWHLHAHVKKA